MANERLRAEVGRLRLELDGCEQEKALAVGVARGAEAEVERLREALREASEELDAAGCQVAASQAHRAALGETETE